MNFFGFSRLCYSFLSTREKRDFIFVLTLGIIAAFSELVGLASVVPVIYVLTSKDQASFSKHLETLSNHIPIENLSIYIALISITLLIASGVVFTLYSYTKHRFTKRVSARLSSQVLFNYLQDPPTIFLSRTESETIRNISQIGNRITIDVLQNILHITSRIALIAMVSIWLLFINPLLSVVISLFFILSYSAIHRTARTFVLKSSAEIFNAEKKLYGIQTNAYRSFRVIKFWNAFEYVVDWYLLLKTSATRKEANVAIVNELPKNILETLGLVVLILSALYLSKYSETDLLLSNMAVFALSAYRVLPALQQVYNGINKLTATFAIRQVVIDGMRARPSANEINSWKERNKIIKLVDVSFSYPNATTPVLENLSIQVELKGIILIEGASGKGKSTLFDLLMGIREPQIGTILVDDENMSDVRELWWKNISYVPQEYCLIGENLKEAICLTKDTIDNALLNKALHVSGMQSIIEKRNLNLDDNLDSISLSGGEKNRLMIARMLYSKAPVAFMDEPFSNLDLESAQCIMRGIALTYREKCLIIISHRHTEVELHHQRISI